MVHGGPDWGVGAPVSTIFRVEDIGELAARLGSIVTFDRRGNVIWMDDFESGIEKWEAWSTGPRGRISWDAEHPQNGSFSAKVVTGNVTGDGVGLIRYLAFPAISKLGCELSFTTHTYLDYFQLRLTLYDGDSCHQAFVKYIVASQLWQYYGSDSYWHDLKPTVYLIKDLYTFHIIKLVVNFATGYYSHLIVNNNTYDLSSFQYRKTDSNILPRLEVNPLIYTNSDADAVGYFGYGIVTQNEP